MLLLFLCPCEAEIVNHTSSPSSQTCTCNPLPVPPSKNNRVDFSNRPPYNAFKVQAPVTLLI
jgi:hypothetical protein